ncbi:MAG: LLM class flavin-dependent oxidoreductase [Antricoccus sp.]
MSNVGVPLSVLDLATVSSGRSIADSFATSVDIAQRAERWGFTRVWYAEHHNMRSIASSATSVLIAHVASQTNSIRLGSGGIMLPNHSPLVIAEQFGTLATLHPGRIDLGLGRAPGSDQATMRALRRTNGSADTFPADVLELQGYLSDEVRADGIEAVPGRGTNVPLYVLGSSLFGAQLAAQFGLPYAFASHFAPDALQQAVAIYRDRFEPSAQLDKPYVIAAVGVLAADSNEEAAAQFQQARRKRVIRFLPKGPLYSDDDIDALLESGRAAQVDHMMQYSAVGTGEKVVDYLRAFVAHADADELILASQAVNPQTSLRSIDIVGETCFAPTAAHASIG